LFSKIEGEEKKEVKKKEVEGKEKEKETYMG
jgi:hypothetical protein